MRLDNLSAWKGSITINGIKFASIQDAMRSNELKDKDVLSISLQTGYAVQTVPEKKVPVEETSDTQGYVITVKQYMTRKASPEFDFMRSWNNDIPMPLRTMVGTIEKETRGMVYMKLHGDIIAEQVQTCMRCGKALTNPVSKFFGMGPECGGHNYVNPFESEEELKNVVSAYRNNYLKKITWEGWIIKSAILEKKEV